jgi:hypothetical protein
MGDANDHAWWDDPARWTNGRQFPMWTYRTYQHIPSQPENDLLPTHYYAVSTTPASSWPVWTPYFSSDLPYADLDGDELPDIAVGRIPCGVDGTDALAYAAKLSSWLASTNNHIRNDVCLLTYARNINWSRAWPVRMFADSLATHMPPGVDLRRITVLPWDPREADDQARVQSYEVAGDGTDVLVWATNWADRETYGRVWSIWDGWSVGMLPITSKPFISLGLACGFNNFDQTEYCDERVWDPGTNRWICAGWVRPVVERLLFDPSRGAIAQIAPTRGSFALGCFVSA